jgi:hypothetical protein
MRRVISESELPALCERVLRGNWREGRRARDGIEFAYTCPSPSHYPWQWYWDSCFTAIVWRRIDPDCARRELESLLAARREDGFIGHTIFWNTPLTGIRRFTYNVTAPDAPMTASIQPPLLAWAWSIAVGDPAQVPAIVAHHNWLDRNRDLDGDGLIWIVQPDESGLDASNQFDPIWGKRAHGLPQFVTLVQRNRRLGYDLTAVVGDGGPVVAEVATNVLANLSRLALGRPSLTGTIVERMYDEDRGLFMPLVRPRVGEADRADVPVTWAALAPLALPDLPEAIGRRLVEDHLLDESSFWLPFGPPSVSAAEPSFSLDDTGLLGRRRYWRGPMWVNAAWLLWLGLVRVGYGSEADELARRVAAAVATSGVREYYDPRTATGMGARDFGWSTLLLEMIEPDPAPMRPPSGTAPSPS